MSINLWSFDCNINNTMQVVPTWAEQPHSHNLLQLVDHLHLQLPLVPFKHITVGSFLSLSTVSLVWLFLPVCRVCIQKHRQLLQACSNLCYLLQICIKVLLNLFWGVWMQQALPPHQLLKWCRLFFHKWRVKPLLDVLQPDDQVDGGEEQEDQQAYQRD